MTKRQTIRDEIAKLPQPKHEIEFEISELEEEEEEEQMRMDQEDLERMEGEKRV